MNSFKMSLGDSFYHTYSQYFERVLNKIARTFNKSMVHRFRFFKNPESKGMKSTRYSKVSIKRTVHLAVQGLENLNCTVRLIGSF